MKITVYDPECTLLTNTQFVSNNNNDKKICNM